MTIRSPFAFMRAKSGTRTFFRGVFIEPFSTFLRFPWPSFPVGHAAKPSGQQIGRRNNTIALPDLRNLAETSGVTEQACCPPSQSDRSKPRLVQSGESFP